MKEKESTAWWRPDPLPVAGKGILPPLPLTWDEKKRKYHEGKWKAPVPPVDGRWVTGKGIDSAENWVSWIDLKGKWL